MKDQKNEQLTDERVLILLNEYAKIDPFAHKLLKDIVKSKEFGEHDMLMSKAHHYLMGNSKCLN